MNLVFTHPSGGRIYQGDYKLMISHEWEAYQKENRKVILLACAAEMMEGGFEAPLGNGGYIKCYGIPLWDFEKTEAEQKELLIALSGLVDTAVKEVLSGNDLVSCCMQGLNRSGLLNGMVMKKLGLPPNQIIDVIRKVRGPRAMGNKSFCKMLYEA